MDLEKLIKKYKGLWVALDDDNKVISNDKDIKKAKDKAIQKGFEIPYMFKVPTKLTAYIGIA